MTAELWVALFAGLGLGSVATSLVSLFAERSLERRSTLAKQIERRESAHEAARKEMLFGAVEAAAWLEVQAGQTAKQVFDLSSVPQVPTPELDSVELLGTLHTLELGHPTLAVRSMASELRSKIMRAWADDYSFRRPSEEVDALVEWGRSMEKLIETMHLPPVDEDPEVRRHRWTQIDGTKFRDPLGDRARVPVRCDSSSDSVTDP